MFDYSTKEETEYVSVPKSLAQKIKGVKETKVLEEEIRKYIEESKRDLRVNIESLDDDVLMYKASMVKAKNAFEQAKTEQLDASYAMWEKFDEELGQIRKKVAATKDAILPLKQELDDLNKKMASIRTWDLEKILELLKQISYYVDTESDSGKILKFLFENYKRSE